MPNQAEFNRLLKASKISGTLDPRLLKQTTSESLKSWLRALDWTQLSFARNQTVLSQAMASPETLAALLQAGADPHEQTWDRVASLDLAIQTDNEKATELLKAAIQQTPKPKPSEFTQLYRDKTKLTEALQKKDYSKLKELLNQGNHEVTWEREDSILMTAILKKNVEAAHLIISHPLTDLNWQNRMGATALMIALQARQFNLATALLQKGADALVLGMRKMSALQAIKQLKPEIQHGHLSLDNNPDLKSALSFFQTAPTTDKTSLSQHSMLAANPASTNTNANLTSHQPQ